jgi:hypothetical protein
MKRVKGGGITPIEVYTLQDARLLLSRMIQLHQYTELYGWVLHLY